MTEINQLPSELLLAVQKWMSPSALKNAVLVDKRWRDLGQDPPLWEWCKVSVYSKEDINNLSIKRLRNIPEILISPAKWDAHDWEAFLRAVENLSNLKKIDGLDLVSGGRLNKADSGLLVRCVANLEDVAVRRWEYVHIQALFKEMSSTNRVKKFHLISHDLSQMDPKLFATVLSRLENLELDVSHVTKDQVQTFFTEILNNRSLVRLVLPHEFCKNMWPHLEPRFFARVMSTVEDVSLEGQGDDDRIPSDNIEALFAELSVETQLKRLSLRGIDLSEIGAALLANALSRLEELSLNGTTISSGQIQALFTQMSLRTQMKKIALLDIDLAIDLSQLDPELFARVMARLEDVHLEWITITTAQKLELFTMMSRNSQLKSLKIMFIDLSPVDPEVLSKVLSRLETLTLFATRMTNDQVVSFFSEMSRTTVMMKINISHENLSPVKPKVLASLVRLEEVRLHGTYITHDQAMEFFREISTQNSHLKKLEMREVDFSSVDREVFAAGVTNVKEVKIWSCNLSPEQVTSIFKYVLDGEKKIRKLNLRVNGGDKVDPEMVRKVEVKLKGQLVMVGQLIMVEEDSDIDQADEGGGDDDNDEDDDDD